MGQGSDASLCRRVAFRLRLTHTVAGGGNIDDGAACPKMGRKELCQIKGRGDPYLQRVFKILVACFFNAVHRGSGVVDKKIYAAVIGDNLCGKALQILFFCKVTDEIIVIQKVNDAYLCTCFFKFLPYAFADAAGTARHNSDFIGKIKHFFAP